MVALPRTGIVKGRRRRGYQENVDQPLGVSKELFVGDFEALLAAPFFNYYEV